MQLKWLPVFRVIHNTRVVCGGRLPGHVWEPRRVARHFGLLFAGAPFVVEVVALLMYYFAAWVTTGVTIEQ